MNDETFGVRLAQWLGLIDTSRSAVEAAIEVTTETLEPLKPRERETVLRLLARIM